MATPIDDSRNVIPFVPTLFHIAYVKVAIPFFNDSDTKKLSIVFPAFQKDIQEYYNANYIRRKTILLSIIPAHLKGPVLKAVFGLCYSFQNWKKQHSRIFNLGDGDRIIIYFRTDGTIDRIKTVQQLVLNVNIDIVVRFDIACMYCFQESMQTLWAEMEESDKTKCLNRVNKPVSQFWVRWLNDGCQVPWDQAALKYFNPREVFSRTFPRFSSFFPLLRSQDRQVLLLFLIYSEIDDIQLCLHTLTKEEEKRFLKFHALQFLILYLQWPMQSIFLETTEKMWGYIGDMGFMYLVSLILDYNNEKKDFDYGELFEDLWIRGPNHLRESTKNYPFLRRKIDNYMNEKRRKRKTDEKKQIQEHKNVNSASNGKKWIRRNGRLHSTTFTTHIVKPLNAKKSKM